MDPKKLLALLEVSEHGSVSAAAQALHVAQPALSRTIREFEASIGVKVFDRHARGVKLTPEGEGLMAHARVIREEVHSAIRTADAAHAGSPSTLAVGIVTVHPIGPLMQSLAAFFGARPEVHGRFVTGTRDQLLEPLAAGDLDLILGPLAPEPLGGGFIEAVIYYEDVAIFCGLDHPLFGARKPRLAALLDMSWILGPPGSTSRRQVEALYRSRGLEPPVPQIEFEEIPARRAMVLQSRFLSVFQHHHVLKEVNDNRLYALPLPWPQDERPIGVIRRSGTPLPASAIELIQILRRTFAGHGIRVHEGDA